VHPLREWRTLRAVDANSDAKPVRSRLAFALQPEPVPVLLRTGIAVLVDVIVVFVAVRAALVMAGHPGEGLTHAVLPAVFGGMFAFLGSLGGTTRSGLVRAFVLAALSVPLTLIAIGVRPLPIASGLALASAAVVAGVLARHGEPLATLGSILLYIYFVPFVFGAGSGVPLGFLGLGFAVMIVCTVALRAIVALVAKHRAPVRVKATDEASPPDQVQGRGLLSRRFPRLPGPQLARLRRTTLRSAIGLGIGAIVVSATRDHNAVWVLMTLIALLPPGLPLTINRLVQRLAGTVVAMVALTVVDATIAPGALRLLVLGAGLVLTIAYVRRSYAISVLGISMVAVIAYSQVQAPLGEALLWRGFDTLVGAVIAIIVTLLIPVGRRPKPVWTAG
jgi:hypothetical protein